MSLRVQSRIGAALVAIVFGCGWAANGWRLSSQHSAELAKRDREALAMAEAAKQIGIEANNTIAEADSRAIKELEHDKKEFDRLRKCVRDSTCGVRIRARAVSPSIRAQPASPPSVGNAAVELDTEVQLDILDLGKSISTDDKKLKVLQTFAQQCWNATMRSQGQE